MVNMTKHGAKRMRERNGLNMKSAVRMTDRVFRDGIRRESTKGRLRKWVDHIYYNGEKLPVIYGDKCYVYSNDGSNLLITVLNIPADLMKDKKKTIKRK